MRHGAKNVRHGAKNVRHGAGNVRYEYLHILVFLAEVLYFLVIYIIQGEGVLPLSEGGHCLGSLLKKSINNQYSLRPELNDKLWFTCIWSGEFRYPGSDIADF